MVPVKAFDVAKGRLADALAPPERAELARSMAEGVIAAARPLPTYVVCASPAVAGWALRVGAGVIRFEPPGLNPAVTHAATVLATEGHRRMIVAHGDLPLARSLAWLGEEPGVTIVPDRRGDGTNVLSLPLASGFVFHYGPGSAAAHQAEATRLGLACRTVDDDLLGWDIDTPDDLAELPDRHRRALGSRWQEALR